MCVCETEEVDFKELPQPLSALPSLLVREWRITLNQSFMAGGIIYDPGEGQGGRREGCGPTWATAHNSSAGPARPAD